MIDLNKYIWERFVPGSVCYGSNDHDDEVRLPNSYRKDQHKCNAFQYWSHASSQRVYLLQLFYFSLLLAHVNCCGSPQCVDMNLAQSTRRAPSHAEDSEEINHACGSWHSKQFCIVAMQKQGDDYTFNVVMAKLNKEEIQQINDLLS